MDIRRMGRTGLKVSAICLGTMTFGNQADEPTAFAIMDRAAAAGVSFFDTADVYPLGGGLERVGRTEEIIGRWLRERGDRGDAARARRSRPRGQSAVHRLLELPGLAPGRGALGQRHGHPGALRVGPA